MGGVDTGRPSRAGVSVDVPAGIVTFLFTDVEGSTRLWAADAGATAVSLERHDRLVREAIEARNGYVFGWAGDHFRGAFADPAAAVGAATAIQQGLAETDWGEGPALRVRIGIHRGRATQRDGDYFGPVPNTAARLEALAAGGQILLSEAVATVVDVEMLRLGTHRLRDVPDPVTVYQVGLRTFPPLRVIDPALSTLPHPGGAVIGRDGEIRRVRQALESAPMVTLTGAGGSGKTRLAVEVAHQELPGRPDGCYFADLSSVSDGSELPAALATAVRLELTAVGGAPLDQVVDHLAGRDALLVLDNCEHIVEDCAEFAERLLARSSSTAILATTRQRLEVAGERVIAVGSLGCDPDGPAVALFAERARAAHPGFELDDGAGDEAGDGAGVRATVAEICSRLDGMPLPIELAAARVAVLTPQEILDRMADRFRLLSGGRGRQRRRTLQATLDWSYDLLDDDEQRFFRRCGVFVGSFDLRAAAVVSGFDDYEAMDLLESLVAKSLMALDESHDATTTRYRLLETVRIYAGDQLARAEEVTASRDAHLAWIRELTEVDGFLAGADLRRAERLRHDWPNIASALEWSLTRDGDRDDDGDRAGAEVAARIAFGSQALWDSRVPATEGRRWLDHIVAALEPGPWRDWMGHIGAVLAMQLDDFPETHRVLRDLIAHPDTDPGVRAQAAGLMSFLSCRQYPDRAVELAALGRGLCVEHRLGAEYLVPSLWASACLALYQARHDDALAGFLEADRLLVDLSAHTNYVVMTGLSVASAQILVGDPEAALATIDSRDWSRSIWDSSAIVRSIALIDTGRAAEAADLVVGFGFDALRGRLNRMANDALLGLAALAVHRGEIDHAWALLQQGASPRTPFTIGLAEGLAERIGHGDELRSRHRDRVVPLKELDGSDHLRAELARIRRNRAVDSMG